MSDTVTINGVEICKAGSWVDASGQRVTITEADIAELASAYDPALQEAALVLGHPKDTDPQYGRLVNMRADGKALLADIEQVDPDFADTLKAGRFNRRSLAFLGRTHPSNPTPGKLYPLHLGLLGAKAPAVKGLKPVTLAAVDGATVIEFAAPKPWVFRAIANVFQALRDHLVETEGAEKAEKVISAWAVNDLRDAAAEMDAADPPPTPAYLSSPETGDDMTTTNPDRAAAEADLQKREADLARREKEIADREVKLSAAETERRRSDDEAFVDGLIKEGRLRPTAKADTLALLSSLGDAVTIELSAGDDGKPAKVTPREAFRRQLSAQPKLVELGEHDKGGPAQDAVVEFASPAGTTVEVDPVGLEVHRKALAYQAQHPGTDYLAAAKAVGKI